VAALTVRKNSMMSYGADRQPVAHQA